MHRLARTLVTGVVATLVASCSDSADRPASVDPVASANAQRDLQPPRRAPTALVWAVGDGANGSDEAKALARRISRTPVDRFLYLGDVYEAGTASDFAANYASVYGALARVTAPTPGNHEWSNREAGYRPYWTRVHGRAQPDYYAFRLAGWQVLSLNSEAPHDPASPQIRWLRRRLGGEGTCRLAFWHRPRYSAGTTHGDQEDVQPFWDVLAGRASVVVGGHEHNMQRMERRDGITEFVSGAGGNGHYALDAAYPGLAFGNDTAYGALRLELSARGARYAFVTSDGQVVDSGRIDCRA